MIIYPILFLLIHFSLYGQDYYISPDGSDDNPGTKDAPFATLDRSTVYYNEGDSIPGPNGSDYPAFCKMGGCLGFALGMVGKQTAGADYLFTTGLNKILKR